MNITGWLCVDHTTSHDDRRGSTISVDENGKTEMDGTGSLTVQHNGIGGVHAKQGGGGGGGATAVTKNDESSSSSSSSDEDRSGKAGGSASGAGRSGARMHKVSSASKVQKASTARHKQRIKHANSKHSSK